MTLFLLGLALFFSRLFPHSANWNPALAIGVIAGFLSRKSPLGFLIPAMAWLASDLVLGFYPGMLFNYAAIFACSLVGMGLSALLKRKEENLGKEAVGFVGSGLASSTLFFVISNFGVWYVQSAQCLPMNLSGLTTCYILGLEFFWPTLISTTAWMVVFGVSYQFIKAQAHLWMVEKA